MASVAADIGTSRSSFRLTWRADSAVLLGLSTLVLAVRGVWFGDPIADLDEQLYSFIGWRMLHGELPYVDWWDRKPFGLFALFALAHWLGGPEALAYQLLAALSTLGGAILTYALARPLADRAGAAIAAAFYVILISCYAAYSGQSEAFHVPLVLAMVRLLCDRQREGATRRALYAMAIGGLALQVKYTVLPQCLFLGLWALWGEMRRGASPARLVLLAGTFGALGIAPTLLVGLFYWCIGQWDAFFFANFVSFFQRGAGPTGRFDSANALWLLPLGMLLIGGLYSACRVAPPRDRKLYIFYAGWSCAATATVFLPSTVYQYYYAALVPAVALLATPLFDRRSVAGLLPTILLLAGGGYILGLPDRSTMAAGQRHDIARFAAAIAPHVNGENECLYVYDGPTSLYRLTGACAPTKFIYPDHLSNVLEKNALGVSQSGEVARVLRTRPAVIVTTDTPTQPQNPRSFALVKQAIQDNYEHIAEVQIGIQGFHAWRLRTNPPGSQFPTEYQSAKSAEAHL